MKRDVRLLLVVAAVLFVMPFAAVSADAAVSKIRQLASSYENDGYAVTDI